MNTWNEVYVSIAEVLFIYRKALAVLIEVRGGGLHICVADNDVEAFRSIEINYMFFPRHENTFKKALVDKQLLVDLQTNLPRPFACMNYGGDWSRSPGLQPCLFACLYLLGALFDVTGFYYSRLGAAERPHISRCNSTGNFLNGWNCLSGASEVEN
jgi:hypothetical protein